MVYTCHARGFACSMRYPTIIRLYSQVPPDEPIEWNDEAISAKMFERMTTSDG